MRTTFVLRINTERNHWDITEAPTLEGCPCEKRRRNAHAGYAETRCADIPTRAMGSKDVAQWHSGTVWYLGEPTHD